MKIPGFMIALAAYASPVTAQSSLSGPARAGDGDSLSVAGLSVRLFGIDAPELDQTCSRDGVVWPCGKEAQRRLQSMVTGKHVTCRRVDTDEFGRMVAVCSTAERELNSAIVEAGWAIAFRKYSDAYLDDELRARSSGLGIWSSRFELPGDYRQRKQRPNFAADDRTAGRDRRQAAAPAASTGCAIKGNHSRRGVWIYHMPGMPYYAQTVPERLFCTEAEAIAAGYRKSRARN